MAKKSKRKDSQKQPVQNVEETLSKTERFLEENYKTLLKALALIVAIVLAGWLVKVSLDNRSSEAAAEMYQAEKYFERDSFELALYGDGNYPGFLDVIASYRMTRSANLARYYAGISYLHLGDYESAIEKLSGFRKRDVVLSTTATGAIGDAWVELGDLEKGADYYKEAANYSDNIFLTPVYLMKAGQVYEALGRHEDALKAWQRIRDDYPESTEASDAIKHIARVRLAN